MNFAFVLKCRSYCVEDPVCATYMLIVLVVLHESQNDINWSGKYYMVSISTMIVKVNHSLSIILFGNLKNIFRIFVSNVLCSVEMQFLLIYKGNLSNEVNFFILKLYLLHLNAGVCLIYLRYTDWYYSCDFFVNHVFMNVGDRKSVV